MEGVYLLPFFLKIKKYIKAKTKNNPPPSIIPCLREIIPNNTHANGHQKIHATPSTIDLIEKTVALIEDGTYLWERDDSREE